MESMHCFDSHSTLLYPIDVLLNREGRAWKGESQRERASKRWHKREAAALIIYASFVVASSVRSFVRYRIHIKMRARIFAMGSLHDVSMCIAHTVNICICCLKTIYI